MKTSFAARTGLLAASALAGMSMLMAPAASAAITVNAGDEIKMGSGRCTLGFIINSSVDGKDYGLTAGHCGDAGQDITVGGQQVGTIIESEAAASVMGSLSSNDGSGDWAVIAFDEGVTANAAGNFGSDRKPITAGLVDDSPEVGQKVCTQGSTTGYNCGSIINVDADGEWIFTNITRIPGDSGGPLYDAETGAAVGVLSTVGLGGQGVQSRYYSVDKAIKASPALSGATFSEHLTDPRASTGSLSMGVIG